MAMSFTPYTNGQKKNIHTEMYSHTFFAAHQAVAVEVTCRYIFSMKIRWKKDLEKGKDYTQLVGKSGMQPMCAIARMCRNL